jgi:hypothetical protein
MGPRGILARDAAWLLAGLVGMIFVSPLRTAWATTSMPWYTPFALWLVVIAAAAALSFVSKGDDE